MHIMQGASFRARLDKIRVPQMPRDNLPLPQMQAPERTIRMQMRIPGALNDG